MKYSSIILLFSVIISVLFMFLFFRNVLDFDLNYYKFQVIDIVYENGIGKMFYILVAAQAFLSMGIFINRPVLLRKMYNLVFLLYTSFVIAFLIYFNQGYRGCSTCVYNYSFGGENYIFTLLITFFLALLVGLIDYFKSNKKNNPIKR